MWELCVFSLPPNLGFLIPSHTKVYAASNRAR